MAALLTLGAVFATQAEALTTDVKAGSEDSPIVLTLSGTSVGENWVYAYSSRGGAGCDVTASGQEVGSGKLVLAEQVGMGPFEVTAQFDVDRPGKVRICSYLTPDKASIPLESASESLNIVSGSAYTPKLRLPGNGALSYERPPTLIWDKGPGKDILRIYRGGANGYVIAQLKTRSGNRNGFSLSSRGDRWRARLGRRVAYGAYSWTVTRRDPRVGTSRTTPHRRFRVGPSPLRHLTVKLKTSEFDSIKRPGISKVMIRSAPYARVRVKLRYHGRTLSRLSFRENRFNPRSRFRFPWRCSRTGEFKLRVVARDRYGNRRQSMVRWNVSASRCAAMKREAEARRKQKEKESGGGGGGGSCTPGYSPCLSPASDYDCAGGSGDGPEYVSGPVYVSGSDPYGLDSDGDGVACESG